MVNRVLNVQDFFFFPGKTARYEGHFLTSSSDPILIEITKKLNESISEIPISIIVECSKFKIL